MMTDKVLYRQDGQIVTITLNDPAMRNPISERETVDAIVAAIERLNQDGTARVAILTGAGTAFSSGGDLRAMQKALDERADKPAQTTHYYKFGIQWIPLAFEKLDVPIIAAVNGPAAGGGLALVCASDIRIAATSAVFSTSFIRIGVTGCDIGTSWLLPRLVGAARAHELMLTSRRFDAAEALRIGLVTDVVPPEALAKRVASTVDALLQAPPLSLSLTKQGMWLALEIPSFDAMVEVENRQQVLTAATEDAAEAMASYTGRRPPHYRNR